MKFNCVAKQQTSILSLLSMPNLSLFGNKLKKIKITNLKSMFCTSH